MQPILQAMQDDDLIFADDDSPDEPGSGQPRNWKLLIVDDEEEIHSVTTLALANTRFDGRGLEFLHAYSGEEAREITAREPDIALILLDVIMETDDAGLDVARYIREELGNRFVRIILRTGQPGSAPERVIIQNYDINDYKEKTELTATKLYTVVHTGLASYRDMVELDQVSRDLRVANEQLQRSNEDLEQFAHIASHDLQAPLRTISAFAEQLEYRHSADLNDSGRDLLQRMGRAATRLREMIRALLQLSRAGQQAEMHETVNLNEVVSQVQESLGSLIKESGAQITTDELPIITGNRALLEELFSNLLQNAIKYRNADRPCQIHIQTRQQPDQVQIEFADNGAGIKQEDCARIFEPFERATNRRAVEGSGIGLATCSRIVSRHGGSISARPNTPEGAVICFTLATAKPAAPN